MEETIERKRDKRNGWIEREERLRLVGKVSERWLCLRLKKRVERAVRGEEKACKPRPSRTMWEMMLLMQVTPNQLDEHDLVVVGVHEEGVLLGSEVEDLKAIKGLRSGCWEVEMEWESVRRNVILGEKKSV
ncbi:hypothetical protein Syun_014367 [Stephania yunnanensis]|uniref:Uncharacterized protein n=1 Tax=Stephania yunnanensis TaxID=152371 RepID=A0AAP0P8P2_9MAGN